MSSHQVDHFIAKLSSHPALRQANWGSILLSIVTTLLAIAITAVVLDIRREDDRPPPPEGCRRLGLDPAQSNFRDQYKSKYGKDLTQKGDKAIGRVKALTIHPIKSCYPVELTHSEIVGEGMKYDRQLTFAQLISSIPKADDPQVTHQWNFMTQRANRNMTKIKTEMWVPDPSSPTYSPDGEWVKSEGCIVVSFPYIEDDKSSLIYKLEQMGNFIRRSFLRQRGLDNHGPRVYFRVPYNPSLERIKEKGHTFESVKIWTDCPIALNMGIEIDPEVLEKLRYALGMSNPVTLMRIDPNGYREVFRCAPRKGEHVDYQPIVGMQDAYPLHIMNFASVHDVARNVGSAINKLDARRFRANIYVTGIPAFAEDHWKVIRIGKARFHVSCRTARCMLPNVNPETAERHPAEPAKTMKKYRVIDEGANPHACLGMQMVPFSNELDEIKVGDEVIVEEVGEHCYIKQS
ncbi:MOSC domain-containing protein [Phyllosticta capitalensis]|uniref:MOSC domain-containing protein n=1 Tax=Phyllosticta capitalensis TaxID=121624 RepID=A0ABR1Z1C2_9PEZI